MCNLAKKLLESDCVIYPFVIRLNRAYKTARVANKEVKDEI